jgi:hypothetical protein
VIPDSVALGPALLIVAVGALLVHGGLAVWLVGRLAEPTVVERPYWYGRPPTNRHVSTAAWTAPAAPGASSCPRWSGRPRLLEVQPTASRAVVEAAFNSSPPSTTGTREATRS